MRGRFPLYYQELFLIRSSIIKILIIQGSHESIEVPGILSTIGYLSLSNLSPEDFAKKIIRKLQESDIPVNVNDKLRESNLLKRAEPPLSGWRYVAYLSYCTSDNDLILEIKKFFKSRGVSIFNESHFRPGDLFNNTISSAIENSKYFFFFTGKPSDAKTWQQQELESAMSFRDNRSIERIIPVVLPGGKLSAIPGELNNIQFVDLRENFNKLGFNDLVNYLG